MAAKKTATRKGINKSEFVRTLPDSMSARDVVAKAKEAGIDLGEKHVHAIRSLARKSQAKASSGAPPKRRGRPPRSASASTASNGGHGASHGAGGVIANVERALVEMVLDHGIRRIEEALAGIRDRLKRSLA